MDLPQIYAVFILSLTLALFIWGKWRYDIVSLIVLLGSYLLGLIPIENLFSGFGHPATITVLLVLILSHGLSKSGAAQYIVHLLDPLSDKPVIYMTALVALAAFLSMFMNNVGALVLLMPVAIESCRNSNRSPSEILMPLSFGSILGGMSTLMGTPTNIIISSYREKVMGSPFHIFDFAYVGGFVALSGILFIALIGWRLVKVRKKTGNDDMFEIDSYLFEINVSEKSKLLDMTIKELETILPEYDITIASLLHKKEYYPVPRKKHILNKNDILILEGNSENIDKFVSKYGVALLGADNVRETISYSPDTILVEMVIPPESSIVGKKVHQVRFKDYYRVNLLGISREGKPHRERLKDIILQAGDVLLIHANEDQLEDIIEKLECFPLATRGVDFGKRKYALHALGIFSLSIILSATNILPIQVSFGLAVISMTLLNIIPVRELYDGVDWKVIILLGSMIPVGYAIETSGLSLLIAEKLVSLAASHTIIFLLSAVMIITMTMSDILNNAATAILMAPIANNIAISLGVSSDPFLMAVAIGASAAFLTPIGHQNNVIIMGPGGYHFGDYWKVGLPLEILIICISIPLLLTFWPV